MLSRRSFLATGTAAVALAATPSGALAQTPKRGGTLSVRAWDPPHFDHSLVHAYKTHVAISFTHSRLIRHRAGANVRPGALVIEGDVAESWTQASDTTYVFKLRKGVRFHPKPPVNGRELTAEDVKYTFERMLTETGSNASMYRSIAKIEAVDRYTVRFTLSEPFAWFLDMVASPMAGGIIARECVEKFGDLKKPEAVIGTGPWMLESYKPNVSITLVRHPGYFVPGLPYIDQVELLVDEDNASRMAAFLSGRYDLGWEFPGTINRTDWVQIKDRLRQTRPSLRTAEFGSNVVNDIAMRTDQKPWSDVRVRQAVSMALDRREIIESTLEGVGVVNGPIPAALTDWALPIVQLGEGARNYRHDPAEAKRLLAAAGYPNGFPASVCFNSYGSTVLVDTMQLVVKYLKAVGIDARLDQKEYGAYQATCRLGKFDSLVFGPLTPFLDADNFLFGQCYTGEPRNRSHVKDPALDDLLVRQRRAMDVKIRREVINDIQRHLASSTTSTPPPRPTSRCGTERSRTMGRTWAMTTAAGSSRPGSTAEVAIAGTLYRMPTIQTEEEQRMKIMSRVALGIAVAVLAAAPPVSAADSTSQEVVYGVGSVTSTLLYAPVKASFCILGAVTSVFTLPFGGPPTAEKVASAACGGTWVVTPDALKGRESIRFVGGGNSEAPASRAASTR